MIAKKEKRYGLGVVDHMGAIHFREVSPAEYSYYKHEGLFPFVSDRFRYENGNFMWTGESSPKQHMTDDVVAYLNKKGLKVKKIKTLNDLYEYRDFFN